MLRLWALLPLSTARGPAEAMRIQDEARALGLKLTVMVEAGQPIGDADLMVFTGADLALFATSPDRDATLDLALRTVPRTPPCGIASVSVAMFGRPLRRSPRSARGSRPRARRSCQSGVFYWTGLTATQPFNTGMKE
jgi:hypothetical protein